MPTIFDEKYCIDLIDSLEEEWFSANVDAMDCFMSRKKRKFINKDQIAELAYPTTCMEDLRMAIMCRDSLRCPAPIDAIEQQYMMYKDAMVHARSETARFMFGMYTDITRSVLDVFRAMERE